MKSRILTLPALLAVSAYLAGLGPVASAVIRPLDDSSLKSVRFEQRLHHTLALNLAFQDESGLPVKLDQYFHQEPVILVPGYYGCPMLCGQIANGLIEALQDITATPGKDFEIIFVSIDPAEKPLLAESKKRAYLKRYGRAPSGNGWHFLTGTDTAIEGLSRDLGFHYVYDPASKQYAHPSGIVVVRPDGVIAQYLFGVTYSPREVSHALKAAQKGEVQSPIRELLLLCFHYTPLTGKYAGLVMGVVRAAALVTLLALTGGVVVMMRRQREKRI
jgi:protein SCO1/2